MCSTTVLFYHWVVLLLRLFYSYGVLLLWCFTANVFYRWVVLPLVRSTARVPLQLGCSTSTAHVFYNWVVLQLGCSTAGFFYSYGCFTTRLFYRTGVLPQGCSTAWAHWLMMSHLSQADSFSHECLTTHTAHNFMPQFRTACRTPLSACQTPLTRGV